MPFYPIIDPRRLMRTPGFNPNAKTPPLEGMGDISLVPELKTAPVLPNAMSGALMDKGGPPLALRAPGDLTAPRAVAPRFEPAPIRDYRGNQVGDEADFQRDQYVRKGGRTDETGKFHAKRDWGMIAQNALIGAGQGMQAGNGVGGALGGAIAGALGSTINPMVGRERVFQAGYEPQIREGIQQRQTAEALQRRSEFDALKLERARGEVEALPREARMDALRMDQMRAQIDATRAGTKDAELVRRKQEADIKLVEARAQAVATGKPVYQDIEGPDGKIIRVAVFPNGDMIPLGGAASAALLKQRLEAQKEIADERNRTSLQRTEMQQAGATGRTAMSQAGADRRSQARINAGAGAGGGASGSGSKLQKPKTATIEDVKDFMRLKKGVTREITDDEAREVGAKLGYTIK